MKEEHVWILGGLAAIVVGFVLIKKSSASTQPAFSTIGKSSSEGGQASTGPATIDLLALSDPSHVFTVQEVQYLLNKWGSSPLPQVTGNWDDTTDLAVRDFQNRWGGGPKVSGLNVDGDPFEVG
ncbi:MAG: peptidoglycan-binding domain-containing protein, partial [Candidatus Cryosericum sp.]